MVLACWEELNKHSRWMVCLVSIVVTFLELAGVRFAPKKFFEPRSGKKHFFGLLGGSGGMLPKKILKMIPPRLAEIDAPGI